jgi:uncharacterized membrane protein
MNIDQLLDERKQAREGRNYKRSDEIKALLETELVFVFDATWGQEVLYLTEKYFERKPEEMSLRDWVKKRMDDDIKAEQLFNSWLATTKASIRADIDKRRKGKI